MWLADQYTTNMIIEKLNLAGFNSKDILKILKVNMSRAYYILENFNTQKPNKQNQNKCKTSWKFSNV